MDLTRVAALAVVAGSVLVVVAVGFLFGPFWGVLTSGLLLVTGGISTLRSSSG